MTYSVFIEAYKLKNMEVISAQLENFPEYPLLTIDRGSYIDSSVIDNSDQGWCEQGRIVHNFQIGRYCSLAMNLLFVIGRGKDFGKVSTSSASVFCNIGTDTPKRSHQEKGSIMIQNDVWIGEKASFMSGVTVHNGAIVGAMSHVVKDVPPYAIVGGNPARIIGYRFDEKIIRKLLAIQWWYWPEDKIEENVEHFNNAEEFCDMFYDAAKKEIESVKKEVKRSGRDRYLMLVDYEDKYSVTPEVINTFIQKYLSDADKELVLYWINNEYEQNDAFWEKCLEISDKVNLNSAIYCTVTLIRGKKEELKHVMPDIKHLIINRRRETIEVMNYAEVYGEDIEVISGVDLPVQL